MSSSAPDLQITDNQQRSQFEIHVDGKVAVLQYIRGAGKVFYVHTGVPRALEHQGIAGQLAKHALDDARARGLRVVPRCPYVAAYIDQHPEYADLVERLS